MPATGLKKVETTPGQQMAEKARHFFVLRFSHLADAFIQSDLQIRKSI